ncbi:MAG: ABC transporter ATP-binding protein [Acetatifactor sp.]|nr:ABC transporter ATP-binding protein [Acetatifactor sp.]
MIEMKAVTKQLDKFRLKPVTFSIPNGYICGLVGENGAGKTTLLHLLLGLYRMDGGELSIDGMGYGNAEKELHDRIGTVLVDDLFDRRVSLLENADYYGSFYSKYNREEMLRYLERFHLDKGRKFGRLSKGEKLKCQFAFALSHDAKLLILDEPTANFDPEFRTQFFEILKEYIADGTRSVILATHLTEDIDRIADYLIYLEKGEQIFTGDLEQFRSKYRMVTGDKYQLKKLPEENLIHIEEGPYGAKALVSHNRWVQYGELQVTYPTIEEFMFFYSKRGKRA